MLWSPTTFVVTGDIYCLCAFCARTIILPCALSYDLLEETLAEEDANSKKWVAILRMWWALLWPWAIFAWLFETHARQCHHRVADWNATRWQWLCFGAHPTADTKTPPAPEMRCCHRQEIHLGSVSLPLPLSSPESPLPSLAGGGDSINPEPNTASPGPALSVSWESTGGRRSFCHRPPSGCLRPLSLPVASPHAWKLLNRLPPTLHCAPKSPSPQELLTSPGRNQIQQWFSAQVSLFLSRGEQ